MTVLVAYASCHGSTQGVAERIGVRLVAAGLVVEVHPVGDVADVVGYDAAVIGSAVHGGRWLPEAAAFARRAAPVLRGQPSWLFSVSTLGDEESMLAPSISDRLRAMRKETPELVELAKVLGAVEHRNFAGAIAPADWPRRGRLFFRLVGGRYGDHRNWPAIDRWADQIGAWLLASGATREQRARGA